MLFTTVFQSTLLQEERPGRKAYPTCPQNFNPRSYKRSDKHDRQTVHSLTISIHAPTRGATIPRIANYHVTCISIHAPTRGATGFNKSSCASGKFQSTLLQEERLLSRLSSTVLIEISIHAPTRGATAKMHNNPYTYL